MTQSNFNAGQAVSSTIEITSGQIKHCTFETLMQCVKLSYNFETTVVSSGDRKKFPCFWMEGGCETTSFDAFASTWDTPENFVMAKFLTQDAKMLHYALTTDQKENQFFLLSEFNDTRKGRNIKLKVLPERLWAINYEQPERLYETNFESLFVNYQGAFAKPGGEIRTNENSSNSFQFSIDNTSQVFYTSLSFSELSGKWAGAQLWRSVGADEIDHELHLGTKFDSIMYFNTKELRHSEITLLQNQCELERTQMLTILMLAMQNTRLAGYMLTGNRSMFL